MSRNSRWRSSRPSPALQQLDEALDRGQRARSSCEAVATNSLLSALQPRALGRVAQRPDDAAPRPLAHPRGGDRQRAPAVLEHRPRRRAPRSSGGSGAVGPGALAPDASSGTSSPRARVDAATTRPSPSQITQAVAEALDRRPRAGAGSASSARCARLEVAGHRVERAAELAQLRRAVGLHARVRGRRRRAGRVAPTSVVERAPQAARAAGDTSASAATSASSAGDQCRQDRRGGCARTPGRGLGAARGLAGGDRGGGGAAAAQLARDVVERAVALAGGAGAGPRMRPPRRACAAPPRGAGDERQRARVALGGGPGGRGRAVERRGCPAPSGGPAALGAQDRLLDHARGQDVRRRSPRPRTSARARPRRSGARRRAARPRARPRRRARRSGRRGREGGSGDREPAHSFRPCDVV